MANLKNKFKLGDWVEAPCHYERETQKRFLSEYGEEGGLEIRRGDALPITKPIRGLVVGLRYIYMTDYELVPAHQYLRDDGFNESWAGTTVKGTREWVLLVVEHVRREPKVVRISEAAIINEPQGDGNETKE